MGVIYLRTNLVNGKKYVGQTQNFRKRQYAWNCLNFKYANQLLTHDRELYGLDNFTVDIIKECDNSELDFWERHFIKELDTQYPNGYNCDEGGSIGFHLSDETKKKLSEAMSNAWTDERRQEFGKSRTGKKNPNFGKFGKDHPRRIPIIQLTKDGEFVRKWDSMMDVERQLGMGYNNANISACCSGKRKTCGGYKWVYESEYIKNS